MKAGKADRCAATVQQSALFIFLNYEMNFFGLHICIHFTAEIEDEFGCYVTQFLELIPLAAHTVMAMWKIVPGKHFWKALITTEWDH